ncbi:MAG: DUF1330 domain-containing protein [Streptomyces sp.]|uniref:DUF1330 domain-containing protein n=1 Tax=Streptomyces sp. TaxID=1931 RepID=UPI0025F7FD22|nr:DUF1330 domain-containing protein [Streptomyces sp.]MBW8799082.1 DUF1330 domain-containing protein [Streptomyces sp.]
MIADVQRTGNAEEQAEYRSKVVATLEPYGGRYLARGRRVSVAEGGWEPGSLVLVELPDLAAARAWNDSPEYRAITPRASGTRTANG